MTNFEQTLSAESWTEILSGGSVIAFDLVASPSIFVYMTESDTPPDVNAKGNEVLSYPSGWDYVAEGLPSNQRIWAKGENIIRGIR